MAVGEFAKVSNNTSRIIVLSFIAANGKIANINVPPNGYLPDKRDPRKRILARDMSMRIPRDILDRVAATGPAGKAVLAELDISDA